MKKLIIEKGYTITVTSWENDGDDYNTLSKTVNTKEEARKLYKIYTELCKSEVIGNSMDGESTQTIINYVNNNKELFLDIDWDIINSKDEDDAQDYLMDYFHELLDLLGSSEYYDFRVCESCIVNYSPEDIYLEKIIF